MLVYIKDRHKLLGVIQWVRQRYWRENKRVTIRVKTRKHCSWSHIYVAVPVQFLVNGAFFPFSSTSQYSCWARTLLGDVLQLMTWDGGNWSSIIFLCISCGSILGLVSCKENKPSLCKLLALFYNSVIQKKGIFIFLSCGVSRLLWLGRMRQKNEQVDTRNYSCWNL